MRRDLVYLLGERASFEQQTAREPKNNHCFGTEYQRAQKVRTSAHWNETKDWLADVEAGTKRLADVLAGWRALTTVCIH